jgi:hypothetical protein
VVYSHKTSRPFTTGFPGGGHDICFASAVTLKLIRIVINNTFMKTPPNMSIIDEIEQKRHEGKSCQLNCQLN